jgi:predicted Rossmann-fold nucleotide-binding protein
MQAANEGAAEAGVAERDQVKHLDGTPLIMVGHMWGDFVQWARQHMLDPRLVNPEDLSIPRCVATGDEAIALIREHYGRWRQARGAAMRGSPGGD